MITVNDFCKKEYGEKLYKISFDAGFTCPNRDGKVGSRGCIFCSEGGSGDFAVRLYECSGKKSTAAGKIDLSNIEEQIENAKQKVSSKYKGDKYIAYFQAFTNTYADADTLRKLYVPIIQRDDIAVLSIATRPDCINEDTAEVLKELNEIKPVWVEFGLQTTKKATIEYIRRGYETKVYDEAVKRLNKIGIHTITHVILYLPGESKKDMLRTVSHCVKAGTKGIKLQLLHVLKGTDLEKEYQEHPEKFMIPTLEEYCQTVKECVEVCPDNMVFHRLTGDAPKKLLIEPKWSADKKNVINTLSDVLNPSGPWYVYMLKCGDGSLYTGSTDNVEKRFRNHSTGRGAKYTAAHLPVEIVYTEELPSKRLALKREYAIKQLSRKEKDKLIEKQKTSVN